MPVYNDKYLKQIKNNFRKLDFTYNANNKVVAITDGYLNSSTIRNKWTLSYDLLNRLDTMTLKQNQVDFLSGHFFKYKANTDVIDTVFTFQIVDNKFQKTLNIYTFNYNANGRIDAVKQYIKVGRNYILYIQRSFNFDKRNNVIAIDEEEWDCIEEKLIGRNKINYVYDKKANWTKPLKLPLNTQYLPLQNDIFMDVMHSANNFTKMSQQNYKSSEPYIQDFTYEYDADGWA